MTDAELEILIEDLRIAAAAWFNNKELLKLEALIREAQQLRIVAAALRGIVP